MTFLEKIIARLERNASAPVLREIHEGGIVSATGGELLLLMARARQFLAARAMKKGDRCALLSPNSIRWAALDLAMMAEGLIVVPLYARQSPAELAAMMKDCTPALICCSDSTWAAAVRSSWVAAPEIAMFDDVFSCNPAPVSSSVHHADHDPVTIIYTSGTSGEPKGVVLNAGNAGHMIGCTNARLDQLMGVHKGPDRLFHYLPFCFAGSWIVLLTALSRDSVLSLSTDLSRLADELKIAVPDYFLNVPTLLERVRAKIEETINQRADWTAKVFTRARREYLRRYSNEPARGEANFIDSLCLSLANSAMFPAIRKNIGPNLKALICGSAPLSPESQLFFMMLGIPVLQVYGLTETTAICTMDDPHHFEPGRVGPAIPGIEMVLGDGGEILVRGPNIFPGYWQRPAETAKALEGGWFHTGDQGDADANGNWRITGRLKNLIILNSGHNIAPEPLEEALAARLPEAHQIVLLGNRRGFLAALITVGKNHSQNGSGSGRIQAALDAVNSQLPHYKQIRAFHVVPEPFSIENGLLTANGKIKRDLISTRYSDEIEDLYQKKPA
jgi:long-chain acyl-CoA synthetase